LCTPCCEHAYPPTLPDKLLIVTPNKQVGEAEIEELFLSVCDVRRVVMKTNGYCFVWTGGLAQAVAAKEALNGYHWRGSPLQVAPTHSCFIPPYLPPCYARRFCGGVN